jgi:hypothetical protein
MPLGTVANIPGAAREECSRYEQSNWDAAMRMNWIRI